jgi:hypothetical protein
VVAPPSHVFEMVDYCSAAGPPGRSSKGKNHKLLRQEN